MKKILILLLLILLPKIWIFSQTISETIRQDSIVSVSVQDIKYANLIFVEHKKLIVENALLLKQIENYKKENAILSEIGLLKSNQISEYDNINSSYINNINQLNTEIRRKNTTIKCLQIGGVVISVGLILALILK